MQLSFLGLSVLPELRITDKGLVDVMKFAIVDVARLDRRDRDLTEPTAPWPAPDGRWRWSATIGCIYAGISAGLPGRAFDAFEQCPDANSSPAGPTSWSRSISPSGSLRRLCACERSKSSRVAARRCRRGARRRHQLHRAHGTTTRRPSAGSSPGVAHCRVPQIRNAGTLGGNLGTASPAGDSLPVLAALDAKIVVASKQGRRILELDDLIVGPKRTTLGPGEVIVEVRVPAALGSQEFLKVGTRNAMVIAVANVASSSTGQGVRSGALSARSGP